MEQNQQALYQAFQRAEQFLATHTADLGPVATAAAHTTFNSVLAAIPALAATQYGAKETAVGCTRKRDQLRETLRLGHMRPIASIARTTLAGTPENVQFQLPRANMQDDRLLAAADAMANRASPYTTTFTAHALPDDFIAQLQAATAAVRQAVTDRANARNALVLATADVHQQLALGKNALRVLDSLVVAQLRATNAPLIVAWNQTKHVNGKPGVPRGTTRAAVPDITPAVATPAATAPQAQAA